MAKSPDALNNAAFLSALEVTSRVITHSPRRSAPYKNFLFATVSLSDIRFSHSVNKLNFLVPRDSTATAMINAGRESRTHQCIYTPYIRTQSTVALLRAVLHRMGTSLKKMHTWIHFWHRQPITLKEASPPRSDPSALLWPCLFCCFK